MKEVARDELRRMVDAGAQLVEVLPANEFEEDHLPGAISIPLRRIDTDARAVLDPARPVIVYCWDGACDLSPRAACRLKTLGFTDVYDYTAGKLDWLATGLPREGTNVAQVGRLAKLDVPTCALDEAVGEVRKRVRADGWDVCVVVSPDRIVLGFLREKEATSDPKRMAEEVMRPGPSTFRPHVAIAEMAEYMVEHDLQKALITTSDGRLVGVVLRDDVVDAAHEEHRGSVA